MGAVVDRSIRTPTSLMLCSAMQDFGQTEEGRQVLVITEHSADEAAALVNNLAWNGNHSVYKGWGLAAAPITQLYGPSV